MGYFKGFRECPAQKAVAGNAADQQNRPRPHGFGCSRRLTHQGVHNRLLITGYQIDHFLRNLGPGPPARFDGRLLDVPQCCSLESAKTEIKAAVADLGNGEAECAGIAALRKPIDDRPSRIAQSEKLRQLIQRFSCRIVPRAPDRLVDLRLGREYQRGMSAGYHESQQGILDRRVLDESGTDMTLNVIDGNQGFLQGVRHCLGEVQAHKQRPDEPGPLSDGDTVDFGVLLPGLAESAPHNIADVAQMFAARQLRHDPAEAAVRLYLRSDDIRVDRAPVFHQRRCRLVAGRFNPQHKHRQSISAGKVVHRKDAK